VAERIHVTGRDMASASALSQDTVDKVRGKVGDWGPSNVAACLILSVVEADRSKQKGKIGCSLSEKQNTRR
jgi:hypothetical protein